MDLVKFTSAIKSFTAEQVFSLKEAVESHKLTILLGNGGSNSVCSHIAQDYTKALGKRAVTFSDPSRLTCYINDYGMERAYAQFVSEFADSDTLVILVSSSGNSLNIFNAAAYCVSIGIDFITLTGFDACNKVRVAWSDSAVIDVWVDSQDYGIVECAHQVFLHSIIGDIVL